MYEAFYGFKEKPFSMLPDPAFLYLSKKHQMAMTLLEYGLINHVGFCVISGEPGAGKTTILRALLGRVPIDLTVGLITNTHQTFGGLLDWILSAFDLQQSNLTQVEMHQVFMDFLIEEYASKRTVLLIVDEAQNMKEGALEELRMLSNINTEKDQLLQVILSGQPALKEMLRKPELMQFAQRIAVDYHLETLSVVETCGYIQHRLLVAGTQRNIFTPAACERIHCHSGGTPRLINLLCETVLVYGFADQRDTIDVDLVDEMVVERMKDSVVPIVNRDAAKKDNKVAAKALEKDFPWIKPGDVAQGLLVKTKTTVDEKPREAEQETQVAVITVDEPEMKQPVSVPVDKPEVKQSAVDAVVAEKKAPGVSKKKEETFNPARKRRRRRSRKVKTGRRIMGYLAFAGIFALVFISIVWSLRVETDEIVDSLTIKESVRIDSAKAEQVTHEVEELPDERFLMEVRIEEERLLGKQQEARRLEYEWLQKQLLNEQAEARGTEQ